jgi:hypothetical protein
MYIAEMYAYGTDNDCVGVNGIDSCMGVFILHDSRLHAIHVPNTQNCRKRGLDEFVKYFVEKNPGYKSGAKLYAVVNGTARENAEDEVREYQSRLNPEKTSFARFTLKEKGGVAFICQRVLGANKAVLKYKTTEGGEWWLKGAGGGRGGFFDNDLGDNKLYVASTEDFIPVAKSNAQIKTLNAGSFACSIL